MSGVVGGRMRVEGCEWSGGWGNGGGEGRRGECKRGEAKIKGRNTSGGWRKCKTDIL